jgi:hypothetical protein
VFETPVFPRRADLDESDVTQILTPIFHALSGRDADADLSVPGVDFEQDPLAAPLPPAAVQDPEPLNFDQPTEKRGPLQVVAGRASGGAHRAHGTSAAPRSYAGRAGFHRSSSQARTDLTGGSKGTGAHRAPEESQRGFVVRGTAVSSGRVEDSGSHHAVSRTGGRHRTLRAVSH